MEGETPKRSGQAACRHAQALRFDMPSNKTSFAQGQIRSIVERIERLEEEKKTIAGDIKEVYAEAKANGFDTKILRKLISIRKKDRNEREEEEAILDLYMSALVMLPGASE